MELPNFIKQISFFLKNIKKISGEFKTSLKELSEQEDFNDLEIKDSEIFDNVEDDESEEDSEEEEDEYEALRNKINRSV